MKCLLANPSFDWPEYEGDELKGVHGGVAPDISLAAVGISGEPDNRRLTIGTTLKSRRSVTRNSLNRSI